MHAELALGRGQPDRQGRIGDIRERQLQCTICHWNHPHGLQAGGRQRLLDRGGCVGAGSIGDRGPRLQRAHLGQQRLQLR